MNYIFSDYFVLFFYFILLCGYMQNLYNIYETAQKPIADKFLYIKLPVFTLPVSLSSFKSVENIYNASDSAARAAIKINLCSKFVHSCETIRAIFQSPNKNANSSRISAVC